MKEKLIRLMMLFVSTTVLALLPLLPLLRLEFKSYTINVAVRQLRMVMHLLRGLGMEVEGKIEVDNKRGKL